MLIGAGYRSPLEPWLLGGSLDCLEITAEHFFTRGEQTLRTLAKNFTLSVHGLGSSLGTPGPLDPDHLQQFARVVEAAQPRWVSEHVAFTRTSELDLGHLNPVAPTAENARIIADHARELMDRFSRPLLLENISSQLRIPGEWPETEFLNQICARAGCGLLLDVTNLFINSRNHRFDPIDWVQQLDLSLIRQLHIVGYEPGDRLGDSHGEPIQEELITIASFIARHAPVEAIILERDTNFPSRKEWAAEVEKLERIRDLN